MKVLEMFDVLVRCGSTGLDDLIGEDVRGGRYADALVKVTRAMEQQETSSTMSWEVLLDMKAALELGR